MRRVLVLLVSVVLTVGLLSVVSTGARADGGARDRSISGWFGYWTSAGEMIRIARAGRNTLGEVNIFMWSYRGSSGIACTITGSGGCDEQNPTPWTNERFSMAIRGLRAMGIHVYASHTDLSSSNAGKLSNHLATSDGRRRIARRLTNWAVKSGVDGVDLDWENFAFNDGPSTWSLTRPRFIRTIAALGRRLHAKGKRLSVTVPAGYAPMKDGRPNPGGGYWVYAWKEIAPHVDRLRLMAYDYSWNRPGPIGPHTWARSAARSAAKQVGKAHRHKVYLGVHRYGKAWYRRDQDDKHLTVGECHSTWVPSGPDSVALTPDAARAVARAHGVAPKLHPDHREWTFRYTKVEPGTRRTNKGKTKEASCRVSKEIWFGGTDTAVGRARAAQAIGIGGIAVWQLANTDKGFYRKLRPYTRDPKTLTTSTSTSRPTTGDTVVVRGRSTGWPKGTTVKRQSKVDGRWRTRGRTRTDGRGRVEFRVKVRKARTYRFRLKRGKVTSGPVRIVARTKPRISFGRSGSRAGQDVTFTVRVRPASGGQRVTRQLRVNGRWVSKQRRRTNRRGIVRFRTNYFPQPQKYRFRALVAPSGLTTGGRSRTMVVRTR